jgi:hypothetical protein
MEQFDIIEVRKILKDALAFEDWEMVEEAIDYLSDFCDPSSIEESEE